MPFRLYAVTAGKWRAQNLFFKKADEPIPLVQKDLVPQVFSCFFLYGGLSSRG